MELDGKKMYSPKYPLAELRDADDEKVLEAFGDRIRNWYIGPIASMLKDPGNDFTSLAIECMLLDALSGYYFGLQKDSSPKTFKDFTREVVPGMKERSTAEMFYDAFRNGILHETRIKKSGFISRRVDDVVVEDNGALYVNPQELHEVLQNWFDSYHKMLSEKEGLRKRFFDRFIFLFRDHTELEGGVMFRRQTSS